MRLFLMKLRRCGGQGTLEYILIAAAVVALAVVAMRKIKGGAQSNIQQIEQGLSGNVNG